MYRSTTLISFAYRERTLTRSDSLTCQTLCLACSLSLARALSSPWHCALAVRQTAQQRYQLLLSRRAFSQLLGQPSRPATEFSLDHIKLFTCSVTHGDGSAQEIRERAWL